MLPMLDLVMLVHLSYSSGSSHDVGVVVFVVLVLYHHHLMGEEYHQRTKTVYVVIPVADGVVMIMPPLTKID
jgi:hypothetical protein